MKKPGIIALALICCLFLGLLIGFYLGRNVNKLPIQTSRLPVSTTGSTAPSAAASETPQIIDINTATFEQLDSLPGIGQILAQRILDYRNENGPFSDLSELTLVDGIGIDRLNKILDYVTVGGQP